VATASPDQTVRFWDPSSGSSKTTVKAHNGKVYWAKYNVAGTMLATTGSDYSIKVWDLKKLTKPTYEFKSNSYSTYQIVEGQFVRSCCFIGNDSFVLGANYDGSLGLYSFKENDIVRQQSLVEDEMKSNIIFCVNNYRTKDKTYSFLSSHEDPVVKSWEMGDLYVLEPQKNYVGHYASVRYVCCNLNDTEVCTCCLDHSIRLWDEQKATTKCILTGHNDNVVFADYVDNNIIVTASWDQTLRVYKVPN
jgi:WD40 repeat protein